MEGQIEKIVSKDVIKDFIDLKTGVDSVVASITDLVQKGVELNRELGAGTGFKKALDNLKGMEDIEGKLSEQTKELAAEQAKLDALYEKQAQKIAVLKAQQEGLNKSLSAGGRSGDVVKQTLEQYTSSTEIASQIVQKFSGNLKENIKQQLLLKKELAEVRDKQKEMNKEVSSSEKSIRQKSERLAELAEREALIKASIQEVNTSIRQQSRELTASEGSINEYTATLDRLQALYKSLSRAERESADGQGLLAAIQELDPAVKGFNETIGQFQRSVGNYAKGNMNYSQSLDILSKRFDEVKKDIAGMTAAGNANADVVQALQKEYELLEKLVNNQVNGFASATAELRNNEKALQALSAAGLEGTAFYESLLSSTAELKDNVGDLKNEIKNLASDTSTLDGIIQGATALAGVYSVAQGAAALFGDENEQLQKTMVRLQAVMAVLNGLQEIQNVLQKDSSLMLLLNNGLRKVQNIQTTLNTAAESRNIVVKYAAIAAQKALNITMSLGNPIFLAILATIGLLTIAYAAFAGSADNAAKSLEELNNQSEVNKMFLDSELQAIKNRTKERVAELRKGFASEEEIRAAELAGQKKQLERLKALENQDRAGFDLASDTIRSLGDLQKAGKDLSDEQEKQLQAAESFKNRFESISQEKYDLESDINAQTLDNQRATTVESSALRRASLQLEIDILNERGEVLKTAAGQEDKSYDDRIKALQGYINNQKQAIELSRKQQLDNPELTNPKERAKIAADSARAIRKVEADTLREIEALRKEAAQRFRTAQFEILKLEIEDRQKAADVIADDEKNRYPERILALSQSYEAKKKIILADRDFELENARLTAEERTVIERRVLSQIYDLNTEFTQRQREIVLANAEQMAKDAELIAQRRATAIAKAQAIETQALNESFNGRNIEAFEAKRAAIEQKYRIQSLQNEINNTFAKVMATKEGTKERFEAEQELADKSIQLSNKLTEIKIQNEEKVKEAKNRLASSAVNFAETLFLSQFENEKNNVQVQIDDLERKKQKEIEVANATITNEQDRAAAILTIETRSAAQRKILEQRQREIDVEKARFEKMAAIFQIGITTAQEVFKIQATAAVLRSNPVTAAFAPIALAQIPYILGASALSIAAMAAKPIPRYADGTDDHIGGKAMVGDAYKSELAILPDGRAFLTPSVPTIMDLPKHTQVLPDAAAVLGAGYAPFTGMIVDMRGELKEVSREINTGFNALIKTVKRQKPVVIKGQTGWGKITDPNRPKSLNDKLQR